MGHHPARRERTYVASDEIHQRSASALLVVVWVPHDVTDLFPELYRPLNNAQRDVQIFRDLERFFVEHSVLMDDALSEITRIVASGLWRLGYGGSVLHVLRNVVVTCELPNSFFTPKSRCRLSVPKVAVLRRILYSRQLALKHRVISAAQG